jgi:subtilisin family serine protease
VTFRIRLHCNRSPARVGEAITVNASDIADSWAECPNFGGTLDIFAPGVDISSGWRADNNATHSLRGTSMAAPHVTGAAALYLARYPGDPPAAVANGLTTTAPRTRSPTPASTRLTELHPGNYALETTASR